MPRQREDDFANGLIAHLNPKSPVAEAYRTLRTSLQFSAPEESLKSIMVTSAGPGEGKSTTLANLAVTLVQAGKRLLIIDADLRRPVQHKVFGLSNHRGLTNLLVGRGDLGEAVNRDVIPGLDLLTSGPIPPNPSELLGSPMMRDVLARAQEAYDQILIDSPPAVAVTDAAIMSSLVSGVILVVRSRVAQNEMALEARNLLEKAGARILGVVLNDVTYTGDDYRYYYYYGHQGQKKAGGAGIGS